MSTINSDRNCIKCRKPIGACFGFVLARDVLEDKKYPRELCGKCGFRFLFIQDFNLELESLLSG
jgi:DNA-directed RNA polymerase subunit RPC12/RpoP